MIEPILFALVTIVAVASAVVVVAHRNPVYSVMSLVVTLIALAIFFILLAGQLLGVLLVLVYAGAILVLFLFVIMLLNVGQEPRRASGGQLERWSALVGALAFGGILIGLQSGGPTPPQVPLTPEDVALRPLAVTLFTEYLLVFEIAGVLLLAAVVAATVLARRPTAEERGGDA